MAPVTSSTSTSIAPQHRPTARLRPADAEAKKLHGAHCYANGDVTSVLQCGWPEYHR
jgi:hypothetical protein